MTRSLLFCLFWFLTSVPGYTEAPWVPVSVGTGEDTAAVVLLESKGIPALSWTTAVVEVSGFEGLTTVPLFRLEGRLTAQDPRWDPWLRKISDWFQPQNGRVRVWVPSEMASRAEELLGRPRSAPVAVGNVLASAPLVTGWTLVSLTLLYAGLMVVSGLRFGWPSWREPRRWIWVPLCLLLVAGGGLLTVRRTAETAGPPADAALSFVHHRWFQETWPWGARWEDYRPGAVWSFPSYEHKAGRLTEVSTTLTAGSEAWRGALAGSLDPHHAVRIFGSFLP